MRRALLVLTLVLVAGLAGCSGKPSGTTPSTPSALTAPTFGEPVPMAEVGGGEPNIAMLPDGTLFVASPAGGSQKPNVLEGSAFLWRSKDGGKTWDTLRSPNLVSAGEGAVPQAGAFCSCDADVTTSADGWVYYADWWIAGIGPGQYIVEASNNDGESWSANSATIPENLIASVDREWLVAGPDGFLGLFYSFYSSTPLSSPPVPFFGLDRPGQAIEAVYSHDHGKTWTTPMPVVPADPQSQGLQIGHPFLAPNGTLMMPYGYVKQDTQSTFWLDPSEVRVAWSTDQGKTWKDSHVADVPYGFDNLWAVQGTVDASTGEVTIVWAQRDSGVSGGKVAKDSTMGLWVQQSGPLGDVPPTLVRESGQDFLPWATARNGTAAVGWYGGEATGDMTKAPSAAEWYAYVGEAPDGLFTADAFTVSKVSTEPVKTGPICPKGAACNGDRELLDYVSLVLDQDGLLHYTFTLSEDGNPHVQVSSQTAPPSH